MGFGKSGSGMGTGTFSKGLGDAVNPTHFTNNEVLSQGGTTLLPLTKTYHDGSNQYAFIAETGGGVIIIGVTGTPAYVSGDGDVFIDSNVEFGSSGSVTVDCHAAITNTKNLYLYTASSAYITADGGGFQGMAMPSDVAAPDITFKGYSAFGTATVNKDGGDVIIQPGANEAGGTGADGSILLKDADGNTELTVATTGVTVTNSLTLSAGARFDGNLTMPASGAIDLPNFTMAAATDYGITVTSATTLDASRTKYAAVYFDTPIITLGGNTLDEGFNVFIGPGPATGTSKYSLGVGGVTKFEGNVHIWNSSTLIFGTGADAGIQWDTTQTNDMLGMSLTGGNAFFIGTPTHLTVDAQLAAETDPTLIIWSALTPATDTGERIEINRNGINPDAWTMSSDRATFDFTIRAISAYASASTNKDGGSIIIQPGANAAGGGTDGVWKLLDANGADCLVFNASANEIRVSKTMNLNYGGSLNPFLGGGAGDKLSMKYIQESVTITNGNATANSSGNLAPAGSIIVAVAWKLRSGGAGATNINIGRTNGGNLDEFADVNAGAPKAAGGSYQYNDGTSMPLINASADTFTISTDLAVTEDSQWRIAVWYYDITPPTS